MSEWNRDERTTQVVDMLKKLLTHMGHQRVADAIEIQVEDETYSIVNMHSGALFLEVGYLVEQSTLGTDSDPCDRTIQTPGYRVGVYKTIPGNRWQPDDVEDVTVLETLSAFDAVEQVGILIVQDIMRGISDGYAAEQQEKDDALSEAYWASLQVPE